MSVLKEKIKKGEPICGTHVQLADPAVCEIFGLMGYDYIWLDMEHTRLSFAEVFNSLNAAKAHGTPVIVRLPKDDLTFTKKVLEMGPDGVIFPMVNTPEEADRLMSDTLYPPYGTRGIGPMRAVNYGAIPLAHYVRDGHLNDVCRFIQIESTTAIENLEKMVENPYIDGYIFGPCDLSATHGHILDAFGEENKRWLQRAISVLKAHGKYIGISFFDYDPDAISYWHELGIDMISVGCDYVHIYNGGLAALENLKKYHANASKES